MKPARSPRFQSAALRASMARIALSGFSGVGGSATRAARPPHPTTAPTATTYRVAGTRASSGSGRPQRPFRHARRNPAAARGREPAARRRWLSVGIDRQRTGLLAPAGRQFGAQPAPGGLEALHPRLPLLRVRLQHASGPRLALAVPGRGCARVAPRARAPPGGSRLDHVLRQRRADLAPALPGGRGAGARGARRPSAPPSPPRAVGWAGRPATP